MSDRVRPYDGVGPLASLEVDDTRPGKERGRGGVLLGRGPSGRSDVSSHSLHTAKHGAWFCASIIHRSHLLGGPTLVASRCFSLWRCDRNSTRMRAVTSCARVRGLHRRWAGVAPHTPPPTPLPPSSPLLPNATRTCATMNSYVVIPRLIRPTWKRSSCSTASHAPRESRQLAPLRMAYARGDSSP